MSAEWKALLAMMAAGLFMGGMGGYLIGAPRQEPKSPPQTLGGEALLVGRIEALEARADEQAKARCFSVKTERLDVAIFANENLGKHKVKP